MPYKPPKCHPTNRSFSQQIQQPGTSQPCTLRRTPIVWKKPHVPAACGPWAWVAISWSFSAPLMAELQKTPPQESQACMHEFVLVPTTPKWTGHLWEPFKKGRASILQGEAGKAETRGNLWEYLRTPATTKQLDQTNQNNQQPQPRQSPISLARGRFGPVQGTTRPVPTQPYCPYPKHESQETTTGFGCDASSRLEF